MTTSNISNTPKITGTDDSTTSLVEAMTTKDAQTTNGMITNSTAGNASVELFFQIGASRNRSDNKIITMFSRSFAEDKLIAMKILFYSRDILRGQGERNTFRTIVKNLEITHPNSLRKNLHLIPEFGRWDDLLVLIGTTLESDVLKLITDALTDGKNGLCAKWMPRGNSKTWPKVANLIRKSLRITPKAYRILLRKLTATANVVEQKMCANQWGDIKYSTVSSLAMKNYRKAFFKHNEIGFQSYIDALKKGEEKISAKAIFPHDIVKPFFNSFCYGTCEMDKNEIDLLDQQWNALPNFMKGNTERIIPVCDVSGSMMGLPITVCVSLGLYISERNEGVFKNTFITFSSNPKVQEVKGTTLAERVANLASADWDMSTDMTAVFDLLLQKAKEHIVPQEQMPSVILIMSDMQFDSCARNPNNTAFEAIKERYEEAGYKMPRIVFWNLNASGENFPVKFDERGTALVSGFSPSILTSLFSGTNFTPKGIMFETINSDRYNVITV